LGWHRHFGADYGAHGNPRSVRYTTQAPPQHGGPQLSVDELGASARPEERSSSAVPPSLPIMSSDVRVRPRAPGLGQGLKLQEGEGGFGATTVSPRSARTKPSWSRIRPRLRWPFWPHDAGDRVPGRGGCNVRRVRDRRGVHPGRRRAGVGASDHKASRHHRRLWRDPHPRRHGDLRGAGRTTSQACAPTISSPSAARVSSSRGSRNGGIPTGWCGPSM
jgi:hypothetical protein